MRKSFSHLILGAICLVPFAARANTFSLEFFNSKSVEVGTGTFSYTGDVGDGTFALSSLPGYSMSFTVGSSTWTAADLATPIAQVEVVFYNSDTQMYFSNTNSFGTGPEGGSADFVNGSTDLTFEPPGYGAPPLDLFQAVDSNQVSTGIGTFTAIATPEPGSGALVGGCALLAALVFRKQIALKSRP